MRAEVGGPQSAVLDDLLQRRNERQPDRVIEVMGLLDDQVDGLALRAHEVIDPGQLFGPLRVSREVDCHRSSFRWSPTVSVVAAFSRLSPQPTQQLLISHYYSAAQRPRREAPRWRRHRRPVA